MRNLLFHGKFSCYAAVYLLTTEAFRILPIQEKFFLFQLF